MRILMETAATEELAQKLQEQGFDEEDCTYAAALAWKMLMQGLKGNVKAASLVYMAGVKCGFSEGVFVMDGQTGMITATQVESDDRDTIQTIKADRDALRSAIEQAIKGADALTTLLGVAPIGEYETTYNFGDITYNYQEDKESWRNYASQGWIPLWLYFTKFEGMSEEEAKKMVAEAKAAEKEKGLFDEE